MGTTSPSVSEADKSVMDEQRPELAPREAMEFDVVDRRRGAGGARRRHPPEAAGRCGGQGGVRRRAGEGLGGRRAHPVGRGHRPDRPQCADPGLEGEGRAGRDAGHARTASSTSGRAGGVRLPNFLMPPLMSNHGNYIVSLGKLCAGSASRRPSSASRSIRASPLPRCSTTRRARSLASPPATWASAATASRTRRFVRGMELRGKYTLIAEGARGSLSKQLIRHVRARRATPSRRSTASASRSCGRCAPGKHQPGLVQHTFGWPLDNRTGGGSFLYHYGDNLVSVGFVVHLNYENPYLVAVTTSSSASRRIPPFATPSRAASASPTARAPSPRAAGNRSRSWPFRAARWSAARPAS